MSGDDTLSGERAGSGPDGDFSLSAGQFMTFEDLSGGGDFNYQDLSFVFTNVNVAGAVIEPAS